MLLTYFFNNIDLLTPFFPNSYIHIHNAISDSEGLSLKYSETLIYKIMDFQ